MRKIEKIAWLFFKSVDMFVLPNPLACEFGFV